MRRWCCARLRSATAAPRSAAARHADSTSLTRAVRMERPYILHMFTPGKQMSPFDINMAADAGYQIIVPYADAGLDAVTGLTQDTIFSRGPKGVARTGIFIGGRDALLA